MSPISPMWRAALLRACAPLLCVTAFALAAAVPPAAAATTTIIHIAADGDDSGTGSPTSPFRTLAKANAQLESLRPANAVEVRIAPGTYHEVGTRWTYHSTYPLLIAGDGGVPTFTGQNTHSDYLIKFGPPSGPRVVMNLTIRSLKFTGSSNGPQVANASRVTLSSLQFDRIGTLYTTLGTGYAALSLDNVSTIGVWSPRFTDIANTADQQGLIHAIYASNNADNITLHNSTITRVSGDPLRFRNGSDNFVVLGGTVTNAGRYAAVSEFFNDDRGEARSIGARLEGVSITTAGYDAPLRVGRTGCFANSTGTTPIQPCDITDTP